MLRGSDVVGCRSPCHDFSWLLQGTSEKKSSAVCIGLPDGEEALFGMHIETLTLDCRYCHTISQVHEQGEAKVIGLK